MAPHWAVRELGVDYAMQVKGLELPAHDPRKFIGVAISYSTTNRGGCHNRAWTVGSELIMIDFSAQHLDEMVTSLQDAGCVRVSISMCTFLDGTISSLYPLVLRANRGQVHDEAEMALAGERIHTLER